MREKRRGTLRREVRDGRNTGKGGKKEMNIRREGKSKDHQSER